MSMDKFLEWKKAGVWPDDEEYRPKVASKTILANPQAYAMELHELEIQAIKKSIEVDFDFFTMKMPEEEENINPFTAAQINGLNRQDILINFDLAKEADMVIGRAKAPIPKDSFDASHVVSLTDGRTQYNFYNKRENKPDESEDKSEAGAFIVPTLYEINDESMQKGIDKNLPHAFIHPAENTLIGSLTAKFLKSTPANIVNVLGDIDDAKIVTYGHNEPHGRIDEHEDYPFAKQDKGTIFIFWGDEHEKLRKNFHSLSGLNETEIDLSKEEILGKKIALSGLQPFSVSELTEEELKTHNAATKEIEKDPRFFGVKDVREVETPTTSLPAPE